MFEGMKGSLIYCREIDSSLNCTDQSSIQYNLCQPTTRTLTNKLINMCIYIKKSLLRSIQFEFITKNVSGHKQSEKSDFLC